MHDSPQVDPTCTDTPEMPEKLQPQREKDVIGQRASIAYHLNLKLLAEYLQLPIPMCTAKDPCDLCGMPDTWTISGESHIQGHSSHY